MKNWYIDTNGIAEIVESAPCIYIGINISYIYVSFSKYNIYLYMYISELCFVSYRAVRIKICLKDNLLHSSQSRASRASVLHQSQIRSGINISWSEIILTEVPARFRSNMILTESCPLVSRFLPTSTEHTQCLTTYLKQQLFSLIICIAAGINYGFSIACDLYNPVFVIDF